MAASDLSITAPAIPGASVATAPSSAPLLSEPILDVSSVVWENGAVKTRTLDSGEAAADDFGAVLTQLLGAAERALAESVPVKNRIPNTGEVGTKDLSVGETGTNEISANETSTDELNAVLTQLLGVTETSAPVTELRTAPDHGNEESGDDVLPEQSPVATLINVAVPWELMSGVAVVEQLPVGQNPTIRRIAVPLAAAAPLGDIDTAMPSDTTETNSLVATLRAGKVDGQTAQLARDVHALLDKAALLDRNAVATSDATQAQSIERATTAAVGESAVAANALSVTSGAPQIESAKEHLYVRAHVGATAWADELNGKLTWLAERGIQSASLRLSPEHLGPLEIRISVVNDQASVWFGAAHADTRSALEQALPRLRELFAEQGLNLADAGVFREPPREQANGYRASNDLLGESLGGKEQSIAITALRARGIVDAYA